jgi:hypothetical protein
MDCIVGAVAMAFYTLVLTLLGCVWYCHVALNRNEDDDRGGVHEREPRLGSMKDPGPQWLRPRFTIRSLMITIAVLAGLLAMHTALALILIALLIPYVSRLGSQWLVRQQHRRLAASAFGIATISTNVGIAMSCVTPNPKVFYLIFLGLWVTGVPTIAALGSAWIALMPRKNAAASRLREAAGISVIVLCLLPSLTLVSLWPLRLAFLVSRGGMESLESQVAAGMPPFFPRRVGVFYLTAATIQSGYVGLGTDTERRPTTGFVRLRRGGTRSTRGPFVGVTFDVYLGRGWWYRG